MTKKSVLIATLALAGGLVAGAAQARDVYWSIGLQAPLDRGVSIGTVISNAPGSGYVAPGYQYEPAYYGAPTYYPAPVYVRPPVVVRASPVVYWPAPVYAPRRVETRPAWVPPGHARRHWQQRQDRHDRDDRGDRWDRRDRGPYGG